MSGNDQMNWDDDLDFESLADEQDAEMGIGEPSGKDADLQDLSYDEEPADPEPEEPRAESGSAAEDETSDSRKSGEKMKKPAYQKRSGIPAAAMGFLFGFAAIVSGLGLGAAVLLVSGIDPVSLWNPEALLQTGTWLDLPNNPLNVLYLVGLGIVLLTVLISWRVHSFTRSANRNLKETEELLGKVLALRLDNQSAWQNPAFKADPAAEAFVFEVLGAWRLQAARQDKNLALEGELLRVEQAVASDTRKEIGKGCEHPVVVRLAAEIAKWYDQKEAAGQEVEAVRAKDQHDAGSIVGVIQDARSWNLHTLDQVGVQAASVKQIGAVLSEASAADDTAEEDSSRMSQVSLTLRELRTDLESLAAVTDSTAPEASDGEQSDVVTRLTELIDRGGKLAFQIAMEVASLGSRGERLLPMAQALEELTTEFRESAGQITGAAVPAGAPDPQRVQVMNRKLEGLIGLLDSLPASAQSPWAARIPDLAQAADKVSSNLEQIAGTFNHQAERLTGLGTSFAELTGVAFDPDDLRTGQADNPPAGTLDISQSDPFVLDTPKQKPEPAPEIDPFATSDDVMLSGDVDPNTDSGFSTDVTPGLETSFFGETPAISQEPEIDAEPEAPAEEPAASAAAMVDSEPELPREEEKVYDLSEFGAERVDEPEVKAEPQERIYDLAEFGAVGLD